VIFLIATLSFSALGAAPPTSQPAEGKFATSQPLGPAGSGRIVDFAPGVRIDWENLQVELDGQVVLREGLLELFACSPRTREHESVVRVRTRPLYVYQAMGLIGLEPGRPFTYDEAGERWLPPAGQEVVVEVRYRTNAGLSTVNAWDWMMDPQTRQPLPQRPFLFCGSRWYGEDAYGADVDGTVVCVVDFDTALIGLPESHSADDALLWVAPNTDRIPPEGTECTLLIRAAYPPPFIVECGRGDRYRIVVRPRATQPEPRLHDDWIAIDELVTKLRQLRRSSAAQVLLLRESPAAARGAAQKLLDALRRAGFEGVHLERDDPVPTSGPTSSVRPAPADR